MNHYVVVGLVELWEESLEVMEHLVPYFFKGAREMYTQKYKKIRGMAHNKHKVMVSDDIKEMVRQNFTAEMEFYNFCRTRLLSQLKQVREEKKLIE